MFEQPVGKTEKDRSKVIMILSGVAVLVVIGLIVLVTSFGGRSASVDMARSGSPEFDSYAEFVKINVEDKRWGERLGNKYGRIICFVENTGDRTLTGLQVRGAAVGFSNEVFKEKILTLVPGQEDTLAPSQRLKVDLYLEPIPDPAGIMDMTVEVHALKAN